MSLSLDLNAVFCVLCLVFWESTNSHHCLYINNQVFGQKCDLSELLLKTFFKKNIKVYIVYLQVMLPSPILYGKRKA